MFNFSANHLLLLSRIEYRSCVVFLMKDDSTRRVYRLYDFTKSQIVTSDHYYCVSGKVNSADKLYLVIESVRKDTKHSPDPQIRLEWTAREKHTCTRNQRLGKNQNHDCLFLTAVDASVCPATTENLCGSYLNRPNWLTFKSALTLKR
jgi:hypothetical protein